MGCISLQVSKLAIELFKDFKSFPHAHSALPLNELVQALAIDLVFVQVPDERFGLRKHEHKNVGERYERAVSVK